MGPCTSLKKVDWFLIKPWQKLTTSWPNPDLDLRSILMASRILPSFAQTSWWPSERIVQHHYYASFRPTESADLLCSAFARLGACFRTWNWHRHGSQDEYFSIRIVQFDARFSLPRLGSSSFRPRHCFGKIGHCTLTAACVQRIIRHKHRSGRQHIPHHHRLHRESRQTVID